MNKVSIIINGVRYDAVCVNKDLYHPSCCNVCDIGVIAIVLLLPLYVLWVVSWLYACLVEAIVKFVVNGRKVESYKWFDELDTRMNNLKHL